LKLVDSYLRHVVAKLIAVRSFLVGAMESALDSALCLAQLRRVQRSRCRIMTNVVDPMFIVDGGWARVTSDPSSPNPALAVPWTGDSTSSDDEYGSEGFFNRSVTAAPQFTSTETRKVTPEKPSRQRQISRQMSVSRQRQMTSVEVCIHDTLEEDLGKALDDLETEAHRWMLRSKFSFFRTLFKWFPGGSMVKRDSFPSLSKPLLQPRRPTPPTRKRDISRETPRGTITGTGLPTTPASLDQAPLHSAKEKLMSVLKKSLESVRSCSDPAVSGLSHPIMLAIDMMKHARSPQSIISTIQEVRMVFPFEDEGAHYSPWLRAYMLCFRVRWSYYLMFALITTLAFSSGELAQLFFAAFGEDPINLSESHFSGLFLWMHFWMLPFAVISLALLGDEMSTLVLDAIDKPPLVWSLAVIIVALEGDRKMAPTKLLCQFVDFCAIFLLEVLPIISAIRGKMMGIALWHGYMQGGLFAAFIATAAVGCADFTACCLSVRGKSSQQSIQHIYNVLDKHKIFPGILSSRYELFRAHFEQAAPRVRTAKAVRERYRNLCSSSLSLAAVLCRPHAVMRDMLSVLFRTQHHRTIVVLVMWTMVSLVSTTSTGCGGDGKMCGIAHAKSVQLPVVVSGAFMIFTVAMLSIQGAQYFPNFSSPLYTVVLGFFLCVAICLEMGTAFHFQAGSVYPLMYHGDGPEGIDVVLPGLLPSNGTKSSPYAACGMSWGSPDGPLSVLDLAALAMFAYEPDCMRIPDLLKSSFGKGAGSPRMEVCMPYESLPRWVSFYFPPRKRGGEGTRVFSVKGTSTWRDIYVDTNLFATIQVLQALSKVVPILSLLPVPLIQGIVGPIRGAETHIWEDLASAIESRQDEAAQRGRGTDKVVLTGHSLGGAIAQIVAARLQLPALLFSAPGVTYSARRFDLKSDWVRHVTVVVPDNDFVPLVDVQAGVVQRLACLDREGKGASARVCHSLRKTACELWRACGDAAGRDFTSACLEYVDPQFLGLRQYSQHHGHQVATKA